MNDFAFFILREIVRLPIWNGHIIGADKVPRHQPALLVANHVGSIGPIALMTTFPQRIYPWVTYHVTQYDTCPAHLIESFIEPELKFKHPLSDFTANLITRVCVPMMKGLEAIPVYRSSKKNAVSIRMTIDYLQRDRIVLIFGDGGDNSIHRDLGNFGTGFARIAREYHHATGKDLAIYPVAVNKDNLFVMIGDPTCMECQQDYGREKERIRNYLIGSIREMIRETGHFVNYPFVPRKGEENLREEMLAHKYHSEYHSWEGVKKGNKNPASFKDIKR